MDKFKKIIIILISILIICIVIMLFFLFNEKNKNKIDPEIYNEIGDMISYEGEVVLNKSFKEVDIRNFYYTVKKINEKYFEYIKQYQTDTYFSKLDGYVQITEEEKEVTFNFIKSLYDTEMTEQISNDQIKDILNSFKDADNICIEKMYYKDINEDITIFVSDVSLKNNNRKTGTNKAIIVKLDKKNKTFSIYPKDISVDDALNSNLKSFENYIEAGLYNKYNYQNIDDKVIINDFLEKYKNAILYDTEEAYNLFDEEYRNKKFGNYDSFYEYARNNLSDIVKLEFTKYLVNINEQYKEYVCKDKYENLYIFKETSTMNYTIQLDTYTLENETFNIEYNNQTVQNKVMMNIDKWFQMLNSRDYVAAFNVLDETFRTTYFNNNVQEFEKYMRSQFFGHYKIEYGDYSEETGISIQEIVLNDIMGDDTTTINETIYMQLNEGTDFVMSFRKIGK